MLFLLCAPALAQSSPSASQYVPGTCPDRPNVYCAHSVVDSPDRAADSAARGTDAVNDAMQNSEASAPAASADTSSPAGSASSEDGSAEGAFEGSGGEITELPETGGASPAALGSGALLVAFGLAARRLLGR